MLDFHVKIGTRFSLQDRRLFEIREVEIMRVNCYFGLKKVPYLELCKGHPTNTDQTPRIQADLSLC